MENLNKINFPCGLGPLLQALTNVDYQGQTETAFSELIQRDLTGNTSFRQECQ